LKAEPADQLQLTLLLQTAGDGQEIDWFIFAVELLHGDKNIAVRVFVKVLGFDLVGNFHH